MNALSGAFDSEYGLYLYVDVIRCAGGVGFRERVCVLVFGSVDDPSALFWRVADVDRLDGAGSDDVAAGYLAGSGWGFGHLFFVAFAAQYSGRGLFSSGGADGG